MSSYFIRLPITEIVVVPFEWDSLQCHFVIIENNPKCVIFSVANNLFFFQNVGITSF